MESSYGFLLVTLSFGLCSCGSDSAGSLSGADGPVVSDCGDGCTRNDGASACAVPYNPADASVESCGSGEVWVTSFMAAFNAFCGKVCTSSSDCPPGAACVVGNIMANYLGAVCVSDQVPTPLCGTGVTVKEGPDFACLDAETLGTKYVNNRTGIAGYEVSKCPNGCQAGGPDGGIWGMTPGNCR
jgi:hypothetical protein